MRTRTLALAEEQIANGASDVIACSVPYRLGVGIVGTADLIMHRYDPDSVEAKGRAAKGSSAKKEDDIASYAYRDDDDYLGIPGVALAAAINLAGKYMQDPRSPRQSAFDLCRAGVVPLTVIARLQPETTVWDYDHKARVQVNRSAVTRVRPAMRTGWRAELDLMVTTPEYLPLNVMAKLLDDASRPVVQQTTEPTYGRFAVIEMTVIED